MTVARWDADNVHGAPSSMDLLMRWIRAPSSRKRWHLRAKNESCEEFADWLQAHGITRTPNAINHKISHLENKCKAVTTWLEQAGKYELYHRGEVDKVLYDQVERRCAHYGELSQFFQRVESPDAVRNYSTEGFPPRSPATRTAPSTIQVKSKKPDANAAGSREQKRKHESHANSTSNTRQKREVQQSSTGMQLAERGSTAVKSATFCQPSEASLGGANTALRGDGNGEISRQLLQCELQQKEELARCQLEGERDREQIRTNCEQEREEIRMTCEKLLSRHKLLSVGVSRDVVDRAFPL